MLNHIVLMGRLTRDPELRYTQSQIPVASFTLAVDRDFGGRDGGEKQTDFIDIVAWRSTAEFVSKYFTKGSMAAVSGRLQIRDWTDREGGKRRSAEVVADNVYFGESEAPADDEGLAQAVELSQAKEFVDKLPDGTQHHVAQMGRNMSGGQKQRLSIARALARKPEILVFDDSFSALDYRTDAKLREGLSKQLHDTTKIIVAQRISTIRHADQILVLDRGEIAGLGTHDALMASCTVYREIAMSQLSEEELKKGGASK